MSPLRGSVPMFVIHPGLAPGATICRRFAALFGCASRAILDTCALQAPVFPVVNEIQAVIDRPYRQNVKEFSGARLEIVNTAFRPAGLAGKFQWDQQLPPPLPLAHLLQDIERI